MLQTACPTLLLGGRALDVGAGLGDFVSCLSQLGMHASGLEAFARSVAIGRRYGLDVREGRFDTRTVDEQFGKEQFDIISIRETLYYLHVGEALELVRSRLTRDGALYIKTHVADSPYYWRGARKLERMGSWVRCFYTTRTLMGVLQRERFDVVAVRRVPILIGQAVKGWAVPLSLATGAVTLLKFALPPDRVHIVARKNDR